MADEVVRIDVQISAVAALGQLKQISKQSKDVEQAVARLGDFFADFSRKTKTPLQEVSKLFEQLDKELMGVGKKPIFSGYSEDLYRATEQFNKLRQAAGVFKVNNQGIVTSLSAVEDRAHKVAQEIEKLYNPQQQRNAKGQFSSNFLPDFKAQLKNATDYNTKLQVVQKTIEGISKRTGAAFRDVGRGLEGAFPELKNTNLVATAVDNLNKKVMGLGNSFKSLKQTASQVDAALAKMAAAGNFAFGGKSNAQNVSSLVSALKEVKSTTGASFEQVAAGMRRMGVDGAYVRQALGQVNKELGLADKAARGFRHGIDIVRTAMGTLVAVGIFQFLNALTGAFTQLAHNIRETELAIYNLINAEKRLSEAGVDVTPKGLQEIIDSVQKLVPILSRIQAEELVSRIATNVAPALRLTNEQIKQMAEATALLYIRNKALGKSFDEVESQLTNAFLTGKVSVGINNLGVKISDQIVKDEALRLGLVKTEKEFNNLTGEMEAQVKAAAMLSVVYKNATDDVESIGSYMETADAQIERTKTAWSNLLTVAGTEFGPLIAKSLDIVAHGLEIIIKLLEASRPLIQYWVANFVALADATKDLPRYFKFGGGADFAKNFKDSFNKVMDSFQEFEDMPDTPTAAVENLQDAIDNFDADEFKQKIEDIIEDAQHAREDLDEKLGQKKADIDLEYVRKAADAERDYLRKVEDINRDAERDIAAIKEKQREEDLRAEEDYQNKLWELRMRFLMDLEEALHARDARQVIRLQKQYEIDKEALERKKNLDDKNREEDQRNQLEDIEIKRQQRLEDAKREYEEKLFDQRLAKQRELDDLNVWYKREQDDLQKNIERKLQALIKGWIDEKKITEQNAAEVYGILHKYFGPGGLTDALYAYMQSRLSTPLTFNLAQMAPLAGQGGTANPAPRPSTSSALRPANNTSDDYFQRHHMAEGGTLIATRPTTVTFGEAGAEMAQFTPLNRIGRDVGTVFTSGGGSPGLSGQIVVSLDLSPDLEARVVENSVNGVADVLLKVNRTKL